MDLIGGYLLVLLVLFTANIALIFGGYKFNNIKLVIISSIVSIVSFILMYASSFLKIQLSFLMDNYSYVFFIIFIALVFVIIKYIKNNEFKHALYVTSATFLITIILFASQSNLDVFKMIVYSLFGFIILFVVYQLSKLLHHAKRQYNVITSEYMCLLSILIFIFALTYNSTSSLEYNSFEAFLILTPTYQLIYAVIAIIVILIIGVFINEIKGGNS
ncbi:MAG: peptide ABC transporter permease [Methanobrevibacter sp.]|uniref:peptide ABC transporter permease n=1 Tax=Methanobrevibacter sp. TaxID=66852 RepID=UPI003EFF920E